MNRQIRINSMIIVVAAAPIAMAQEAASRPVGASRSTLDYRIDPLVNLYQHARALATDGGSNDEDPLLQSAVEAAGRVHEALGKNLLAWSALDRELIPCRSGVELRRAFEALPEPLPMLGGRTVSVRADAIRFAEALAAAESAYVNGQWKRLEASLVAAKRQIETGFGPKEAHCLAYVLDSLGMVDPGDGIPVYLVTHVSSPGAVTMARHDGGGVCFVGVGRPEHAGTLLFETVLHEVTHALDLRNRGKAHALSDLRRALIRAGIPPNDPRVRNVPHTIIFVQAGETIRRLVDPAHRHYGDVSGYYDRMGARARVERSIWQEVLDGKRTRQEALEEIVTQAMKADPPAESE